MLVGDAGMQNDKPRIGAELRVKSRGCDRERRAIKAGCAYWVGA